MSKFDSLGLEVDKPTRMTIVHPVTRQPLRFKGEAGESVAYIDLYSRDSEIRRKHDRTVTDARLGMRGQGKLTSEMLEAEATELLVALTAGWGLANFDGDPIDVPFSAENARELYTDRKMAWLRDQVDEFTADRGNFSRAS